MKNKDTFSQKKVAGAGPTGSSNAQQTLPAQIEARFRAVFENSRDAIGVSKAGIHVFANPAYHELFGFPREADLAGKPVLDLIAPESRDQIREYVSRRIRGESAPPIYQTRGLRADGSAFDMEANVSSYQENSEDHTLVILRDITEHKRAEEEIAERGAMLQQIMDTASVAIGLVDMTGRITHANRRMAEMFGRTLEELAGCEYVELVHPSEREIGRKKMLALLASEIPSADLERLYWRKDGTEFWGHLACRRFHDVRGNECGLIGVIADITERKQSELALKLSEEKYRRFYNETPILLHSIDRQGTVVEVNDYWLKTMGYERSEVVGRKVTDFFTDASRTYARDVIQPAFFRTGSAKDISYQFVKKNGDVVDVLLSATAERDASGEVVRSQAVIEDVTERKRAEQEIREKEDKYRVLFEAANDGIFIQGATGFIDCNQKGAEMYGLTKEEIIGRSPSEFAPERQPDGRLSAEVAGEKIQAALSGVPQIFEWQPLRADGSPFDVEITLSRLELGGSICSQAIVRDISERKLTERALRSSELRFRSIIENATAGILVADYETTKFLYANPEICRILGYSRDELLALEVATIHPAEELPRALKTFSARGGMMTTCRRKDGTVFPVEIRSVAIELEGRQCLVGFFVDMTERKLLEEERLKTQKLESLGTLAGGIAHDFNNLLQGVFGFISMAKLTLDQKEKSLAMLAQAEKALHQSVNLTSQLLTFSKGGKPVKKVLDLRSVIENSVAFALSGSHITYEIIVDNDVLTVEADEGQVGRVIQNIVLNADQATPLGGTIRITVRNVQADAIMPRADLKGDFVEISISDRGIGISPEHLTRIFDPYFTTKEKGSGLGLATTYSIIKNHGGLVRVQSEVGKGTAFFIYLPASGAVVEKVKSPVIPAAARKARILVMDDEEMVRAVAGELLAAIGHEVAVAASGAAALKTYQAARDAGTPFDVVILDLTIRGGMGGIETLRKLAEIDPDVRAVVSSGYSDDAALSDYREQGFRAFLKKPYNIEELQNTLNALLA